jgi:hypothetical protein
MDNKQTAVDWLIGELFDGEELNLSLIYKAKAMEKEQIKDAYEAEQNNCRGIFKYNNFEHYYNETYGRN